MKNRVNVPQRIRALLQQEIGSQCPFCRNQDVAHFEVHHIEGDPGNSKDMQILLLVCRICHSKIESGEIPYAEVVEMKRTLQNEPYTGIELNSVVIDSSVCNWCASDENKFAFFKTEKKDVSIYPLLNFTFTNHLPHTIILTEIEVLTKLLPRGLSGFGPKPRVLKSLYTYHLELDYNNIVILPLIDPIEVSSGRGFKFQIELSIAENKGQVLPIVERIATYFSFKFGNKIVVKIPAICFNCNDENEKMRIYTLS